MSKEKKFKKRLIEEFGEPMFNKEENAKGKPTLPYTQANAEAPHLLIIHEEGKSTYVAVLYRYAEVEPMETFEESGADDEEEYEALVKVYDKLWKTPGIFFEVVEVRMGMVMVSFIFRVSNDVEYKPKAGDKVGEYLGAALYFPIDDEDEENEREAVTNMVAYVDLSKFPVVNRDEV
jgi:hypothetical protein